VPFPQLWVLGLLPYDGVLHDCVAEVVRHRSDGENAAQLRLHIKKPRRPQRVIIIDSGMSAPDQSQHMRLGIDPNQGKLGTRTDTINVMLGYVPDTADEI
jgi:hypothetical protein